MKLKLDITPDLVAAMAAEVKAGEKAVTAAMREAGTGLKTAWRGQITGAGARTSACELDPEPDLSEGRREPERGGAGLVQGPGHRRRPRNRPDHPLEGRVLAGDPNRGRRARFPRRQAHPRRMGAPPRPAACDSSIDAGVRACSSPTAPASTPAAKRSLRARRPAAIRSPRRSSCWSRRSSCRSGSTSTETPSGRSTVCRG